MSKTLQSSMPVLAFAVIFIAILFSATTAFAATINVPGDFPTIQTAITAAASGDTIQVAAGTYSEPIQTLAACGFEPASYCIDKPLTLRGDPGDSSAGPGVGAPVLDGTGLGDGSAIALLRGSALSGVVIEGFVIRDYTNPVGQGGVGSGVLAWNTQSSDIVVQDNTFEDLGWNGVLVGSDTDTVQSGWTVQNNIIDNAAYAGVELTNVTDSAVSDNEIIVSNGNWDAGDSGVGIEIAVRDRLLGATTAGTNGVVSGNTITGGGVGARAGVNLLARAYNLAGTDANLSGVTVSDNDVSGVMPRGIYVVAETRNAAAIASIDALSITDNIISGNGNGVVVKDFVNGGGTPSHSGIAINTNAITGNGTFGVEVENGNTVDATCNWWGNADGPSGSGPGSGDAVSVNATFQPWLTTSNLDGPCNGPLPPRNVNSTRISINVMNRGSIDNTTQADSHTGANTALGSVGGSGGSGGNVTSGVGGNENNGGASVGDGGDGGAGCASGFVGTGNASADAGSLNDVNSTDVEVDVGCGCGDINGLTVELDVDNDARGNVIGNLTQARGRTGDNHALGSTGGNGGNGGVVDSGSGNENNGGASAGTGGTGGTSDDGGTVVTGNANSTSGSFNLLNTTFLRVRL